MNTEEKLCKNCETNKGIFGCKYCKKIMCYQCVLDKSSILIKSLHQNKSCYECYDEYIKDCLEQDENLNEKKIELKLAYIDQNLTLPNDTLEGLHDGWLIQCNICHNIWNGIEKCPCLLNDTLNNYKFDDTIKEKSIKSSFDPVQKLNHMNCPDLKNELLNDNQYDILNIEENYDYDPEEDNYSEADIYPEEDYYPEEDSYPE